MSNRYVFDKGWLILLRDMNISAQDVLRQAQLPLDLLSRKTPTLSGEEYLRLWNAFTHIMRDDPAFPLHMGQHISAEVFSPPLFASFCSPNLNAALERIAYYKPLVGPLRMHVTVTQQATTVRFVGLPEHGTPPPSLMAFELVFWVQLARIATRERIVPQRIHSTTAIPQAEAYGDYFGRAIQQDRFDGLTFSASDASRPFLTASDQMWSIFEPQLNMRMQDLHQESRFRDRVRACLMEILASGQYSMATVAERLAVSPRTLQRRLRDEGTSFQKELDNLREELALNYLAKSDYTSGQIAFLLGYEDPNSFFRAFRSWTGKTPDFVRASIQ